MADITAPGYPTGAFPCSDVAKNNIIPIKIGDVVNVTFPGIPPLRIARFAAGFPNGRTSGPQINHCGRDQFPDLTTNTFTWTVQPYQLIDNTSSVTLGDVGTSVIFSSTEIDVATNNSRDGLYYYSGNYTIVLETGAARSTIVRGWTSVSILQGIILALLIPPCIFGMMR